MAEPKGKKPAPGGGGLKNDTEVIGTVVAILFILTLVAAVIGNIQSRSGVRLDENFSFINAIEQWSGQVTDTTPLGTLVTASRETSVWKTSLHDTLAGIQQFGALGRLVDGPVKDTDGSWWNVDFENIPDGWVSADDLTRSGGWFARLKRIYIWIAWIISLAALTGAVYTRRKHKAVVAEHKAHMKLLEQKIAGSTESQHNQKWEHITELSASENPGDWRIAIIEADVMLDELVTSMGHHGDSLGEKLKGIEQSDFATLEAAWEAHKTRNRIAHSGSDYILTHREAKRIIDLFRQVFEEFDVI